MGDTARLEELQTPGRIRPGVHRLRHAGGGVPARRPLRRSRRSEPRRAPVPPDLRLRPGHAGPKPDGARRARAGGARAARSCCKSSPDNLAARRALGDLYWRQSDLPRALEQFQSAVALAPGDHELADIVQSLQREVAAAAAAGGVAPEPAASNGHGRGGVGPNAAQRLAADAAGAAWRSSASTAPSSARARADETRTPRSRTAAAPAHTRRAEPAEPVEPARHAPVDSVRSAARATCRRHPSARPRATRRRRRPWRPRGSTGSSSLTSSNIRYLTGFAGSAGLLVGDRRSPLLAGRLPLQCRGRVAGPRRRLRRRRSRSCTSKASSGYDRRFAALVAEQRLAAAGVRGRRTCRWRAGDVERDAGAGARPRTAECRRRARRDRSGRRGRARAEGRAARSRPCARPRRRLSAVARDGAGRGGAGRPDRARDGRRHRLAR